MEMEKEESNFTVEKPNNTPCVRLMYDEDGIFTSVGVLPTTYFPNLLMGKTSDKSQ